MKSVFESASIKRILNRNINAISNEIRNSIANGISNVNTNKPRKDTNIKTNRKKL